MNDFLQNRIPPPVTVGVLAALMAAASRALPAVPLALPARAAIGAAVVGLGFSWVARGFLTFRAAGTTIDPVNVERASALVTHGPFARSRNPMYVGFSVMLAGWAVALGSPWLALGPAMFVAFTHAFQILPEERAMRARFGEAYAAYAARVPRWL